jgi:drug/metabolite transporter (DMT)-like permease
MNGGLCAAIVACNTVFVMILAYFMFGEKITKISFIAIIFLVVSAVLVGLFTPDI